MMKKVFAIVLLGVLALSCTTESTPDEQSQMVIYVVDYGDNEFQAGTVLNLEKVSIGFNSIEIDIEEEPIENDVDGSISLFYDPTGQKVFEGGLNIEGAAQINYPGLSLDETFFVIENTVSLNSRTIEDIGGPYNESFTPVWAAVNQLGLSEIFINNNAMIGRFLYKPNEDNSENWKWILFLLDP